MTRNWSGSYMWLETGATYTPRILKHPTDNDRVYLQGERAEDVVVAFKTKHPPDENPMAGGPWNGYPDIIILSAMDDDFTCHSATFDAQNLRRR